jgi:phosphoribosylglycinamide formyltransferase 1
MNRHGKLKLAVLISGRGSNMAAIARACLDGRLGAEVVLVISEHADAAGLTTASLMGLATAVIEVAKFDNRAAYESALAAAIERSGADLVVLAGFMRILSAPFVRRYSGRILNIHPSLLPKYKGLHTHRRALEAGDTEHGASVHFVTDELDGGPVICQARVLVQPGDTEHGLAARVMRAEQRIYPLVIGLLAAGRWELQGTAFVLDGQPLQGPIGEGAHDP